MKLKSFLLTTVIAVAIGSAAFGGGPSNSRSKLLGGWSRVATGDPGVKAAADHAVAAQSAASGETLRLVAVQEAHAQVVAGTNYRLALTVERDGREARATAVIWSKLDGSYELTNWSWAD